jgi:4-oxalocrotonate tautomerase
MPIVTVQWLAGRTPAQKTAAAARLTDVIADVAQIDRDDVWVIFQDVARDDWVIGAPADSSQRESAR